MNVKVTPEPRARKAAQAPNEARQTSRCAIDGGVKALRLGRDASTISLATQQSLICARKSGSHAVTCRSINLLTKVETERVHAGLSTSDAGCCGPPQPMILNSSSYICRAGFLLPQGGVLGERKVERRSESIAQIWKPTLLLFFDEQRLPTATTSIHKL